MTLFTKRIKTKRTVEMCKTELLHFFDFSLKNLNMCCEQMLNTYIFVKFKIFLITLDFLAAVDERLPI